VRTGALKTALVEGRGEGVGGRGEGGAARPCRWRKGGRAAGG
jgi:hypothetical protein